MTRTDIESILSDGTKDTKYIIIYRAYNSVNGIDLYPVIAKKKDVKLGYYIPQITLNDNRKLVTIQYDRVENVMKHDDCIFGHDGNIFGR